MDAEQIGLTVAADDATLAGSWWCPDAPVGTVLMIPGSGPSTRDNDVYFPSIRERLLACGLAVASFDKRGAGESTGWFGDATIEQQASDAHRCLDAVRDRLDGGPVAVFGHSQGGWVAMEVAARDPSLGAVVANAGPTVGVAEQERYRLVGTLDRDTRPDEHRHFDALVRVVELGGGVDDAVAAVAAWPTMADELRGEAELWPLFAALYRHAPGPALGAIRVPTLCVYGSRDLVVPVASCVSELDRLANPYIDVAVVAGGDHRILVGPSEFAPGYVEVLTGFLMAHLGPT